MTPTFDRAACATRFPPTAWRLVAAWLLAVIPAAAADAGLPYDFDEKAVSALIHRNTPADLEKAGAEIHRLLRVTSVQGAYAANAVRFRWVVEMMKVGRHEEALPVIDAAIDRVSYDIDHVDGLQRQRVRCLLALGRHEEALGHAKVYFNLCYMKSTADALSLLVECLRVARPNEPELVDRFIAEQTAGATVTDKAPPGRTSVLDGIKVPAADLARYERQIKARRGAAADDAGRRMSLGNYLLMADRPAEARRAFEVVYDVKADGQFQKEVTENVARALRAEDGAIGRANAWVLAHR